jgi:hypothetical protein
MEFVNLNPYLVALCSCSVFVVEQIEKWNEQRENGTWFGKY